MQIRKKWLNQLKNFFNKHFWEYYLASFCWWISSSCENHCTLMFTYKPGDADEPLCNRHVKIPAISWSPVIHGHAVGGWHIRHRPLYCLVSKQWRISHLRVTQILEGEGGGLLFNPRPHPHLFSSFLYRICYSLFCLYCAIGYLSQYLLICSSFSYFFMFSSHWQLWFSCQLLNRWSFSFPNLVGYFVFRTSRWFVASSLLLIS